MERGHDPNVEDQDWQGHHAIRPREYKYRVRGEFFSNRVVRDYNGLPNTVKQAETINSFKNSLDDHGGIPTRAGSRPTGVDQWGLAYVHMIFFLCCNSSS